MSTVVIYYVLFVTYVEKAETNSFMKLAYKFVVTSDCVTKVMREFAKKKEDTTAEIWKSWKHDVISFTLNK